MAENMTLLDMLKQSDGLLFMPANAGDLAGVLNRVRDELGVEPPDDYMALLHQTDGVVADGVMIYGSKEREFDDVEMPELVEINLRRRDYREDLTGLLLLGEKDDDFIGYRVADSRYGWIDRVSGDFSDEAGDLHTLITLLLRP